MTERERLTVEVAAAKVRLKTWTDMVSSSYKHWQKCYAERNHAAQMWNALCAELAALPPDEPKPAPKPAPKPCPREVGRRYRLRGSNSGKWAECILALDNGKARLFITNPGESTFSVGWVGWVGPADLIADLSGKAWEFLTAGCECEALDD